VVRIRFEYSPAVVAGDDGRERGQFAYDVLNAFIRDMTLVWIAAERPKVECGVPLAALTYWEIDRSDDGGPVVPTAEVFKVEPTTTPGVGVSRSRARGLVGLVDKAAERTGHAPDAT
jgi:hypothetical protein